MKNQNQCDKKVKKAGFFIFTFKLLIFNSFGILPATATTGEPVLSVVHSQENQQQWAEITQRLQAINVKYCVIPIANVRSAADWGDRKVLFLPNVEKLTSVQAIALQEWMSKGGNLIASGPVGSLSDPGVRQLMRSLLGSYWGFSLNQTHQIQSSKTQNHQWANQKELFGQAHGGVLIPNNVTSQAAAVWNSPDHPAAVVTTESSTFFGWRWGTNTASTADLDRNWLKAALTRHTSRSSNRQHKIAGGSPNCSTSVAAAPSSPAPSSHSPVPTRPTPQSPVSTRPSPQSPVSTRPSSPDELDQLQQAIPWDVSPNSNAPIDRNQAIALQQELENLIGRVESAHLAASAYASSVGDVITNNPSLKGQTQVASSRARTGILHQEPNTTQARAFVKTLPQLIAQKKYALARQQWLATKANLWKQFPVNSRLAQAEIRAVWLDRGTIVRAGSEKELAKIFDRLAKSGINTVFFETVNAGYTIYPSQVAPQANPLIRGWDPLAAGVKLAHARGMELHAWVWVFAAGNQMHNQLINASPDYPGPVLAANPDWANYDHQGKTIPDRQTKPFYDPANPELRQYLLKLYEEIVTRYQVDGIQLDYIRYPFQDPHAGRSYGYGKAARAQFQQLHGVDPLNISPSNRDLWQQWTAFRTEQVDSFVSQVTQQLRKKRPDLIFSVAVFPLPEIERIQKLQQNWEVWARRGDIDLIVPMTYAQDTSRFQRLAQPWIASRKLGSTLLLPGIRLLSLPNVGAFDQLQLIRDLPVSGYALFAAENFNHELEEIFNNTQGQVSSRTNEPIPHRQPFKSAAVRYTALQREWQLVLQNDELQISAATIADFNQQVKVVQAALNQLAVSPSAANLIAARATLTRFQSRFRIWMRQQATVHPYQVNAWENRIVTIERLLRYGERRSQAAQ
ncbi:glycoside hydrolase family 10 protein [Anabaena sp. CCY 0017]|uniref:glycoside hydrolase family 10 protein n=1 Tax=Anabaena sp. CCY 0017 TaxID=3103866 RepID=UPI0039C63A85